MNRRVLVNLGIVLLLILISYVCFITGKAYDIIVENVPYTHEGVTYESIEAVQASLDNSRGEPIYLLDGDRLVETAIGRSHILKIEVLDEQDKPSETVTITFEIDDLKGSPRVLNVPYYYVKAKEMEKEE